MSPLWMVVIGLWCSVVLVITGCGSSGPPTDPVSAYVHLARSRAFQSGSVKSLANVINGLRGGVVVVADRDDEIAADIMATVSGSSLEDVRLRAGRRITVTNDANRVEVRLLPGDGGNDSDSQISALLHVAVPPAIDLPGISLPSGNLEVYGDVGRVTGVISNEGSIEVRGANGDVNLSTPKGSITADVMQNHTITLRAGGGNIDLHAVNAVVSAATTNGNVRFIGTLQPGQTHSFATTAAGAIELALPAYPAGSPQPQIYRSYITTSGSPVNVEYPALGADDKTALPICGFIHSSGPYDYHVENTQAAMGRIEVSPVVTGTYFFSGTLATNYFRFDTNQTRVSFYTPLPQSIHIYTAEQLNQINLGKASIDPDCKPALEADSKDAIVLKLNTDSGPVSIQQMRMFRN